MSFLSKEAEHVEGFAKECAVVTHHRLRSTEGGKARAQLRGAELSTHSSSHLSSCRQAVEPDPDAEDRSLRFVERDDGELDAFRDVLAGGPEGDGDTSTEAILRYLTAQGAVS